LLYKIDYFLPQYTKMVRIGVDYGNVLSVHTDIYESKDESASDVCGITVPGAVDALIELKKLGHTLHLVSYCGKKRAGITKKYLEDNYSGVFEDLFFVKHRKYKNDVCKRYGLSIMIDDRADIIATITHAYPILFNDAEKYKKVFASANWPKVVDHISRMSNKIVEQQPDESIEVEKFRYV
jgi:hypothetical protein